MENNFEKIRKSEEFTNHVFYEEDEIEPEQSWSVPFSDLMLIMFILFAVLYCYAIANQDVSKAFIKKENARSKVVENAISASDDFENMEKVFELSKQTVQEANLEGVSVALQSDRSIMISVKGPMYFELGDADLKKEKMQFLDKVAVIIRKTKYQVRIIGHTDNFPVHNPNYPTNWELSTARAARVVRYLIENNGLEPERFTVIGNSMYKPSVPNTSLENKALNRRVEIIITKEKF